MSQTIPEDDASGFIYTNTESVSGTKCVSLIVASLSQAWAHSGFTLPLVLKPQDHLCCCPRLSKAPLSLGPPALLSLCPLLLPKGRLKTQTGGGEEERWGEREREPQRAGRTTLPSTVQVPRHVQGHLGGPPPGNFKDRVERMPEKSNGFRPLIWMFQGGQRAVLGPCGPRGPKSNMSCSARRSGNCANRAASLLHPLHLSSVSLFDLGPIIG